MLIENIQRKSLTPLQEARGFDMMRRLGAKRAEVVRRTGLPESYVDARLSLLSLDPKVAKLFDQQELPMSAVKTLAALEKPSEQERFALMAVSKLLTQKQLEAAVRRHLRREKGPRRRVQKRMVDEDELFTRREALQALKRLGMVSFGTLGSAFNDVCEDLCQEGNNPELCQACPVPRFILSVIRRVDAQREDAERGR